MIHGFSKSCFVAFGGFKCISKSTIKSGVGLGCSLRKARVLTLNGLSVIHELLLGEVMTQLVVAMNFPLLLDWKHREEL